MARTILPAARPVVALPLIATLMGLSLFLLGCKGEVGPAGPRLTGALTGNVALYAADGSREYDDSGVSVWIEGSTDTTLTDSLGRWRFEGLGTGIYSIMMRKAGYGYTKIPSAQFVGGGDLYLGVKALVADPGYRTTLDILFGYAGPATAVGGSATGAPPGRNVLIFVGRRQIDRLDPLTYIDTLRAQVNLNGFFTSAAIRVHDPPWNFSPGDTIYFQAFPVSGMLDGYLDPATGRTIFSTGTSAAGDSLLALSQ